VETHVIGFEPGRPGNLKPKCPDSRKGRAMWGKPHFDAVPDLAVVAAAAREAQELLDGGEQDPAARREGERRIRLYRDAVERA
jgi:hypothetical protein